MGESAPVLKARPGRKKVVHGKRDDRKAWLAYDANGDFVTWTKGDTAEEALGFLHRLGGFRADAVRVEPAAE